MDNFHKWPILSNFLPSEYKIKAINQNNSVQFQTPTETEVLFKNGTELYR